MHQKAIEQEKPNILITDLAGEGKIDASVGCWIDEKPWFFGNPSKPIDCWRWTSGKTAIDPFLMHSLAVERGDPRERRHLNYRQQRRGNSMIYDCTRTEDAVDWNVTRIWWFSISTQFTVDRWDLFTLISLGCHCSLASHVIQALI